MKNIAILVPEAAVIEAVADPRYMFSAVNEFLKAEGKEPMFNIQLVGISKEVRLADGIFSIHTDTLVKNAANADLIIIPAISGNLEVAVQKNAEFFPWIVSQFRQGAEVASLCLGAFLLAATGLVNGKKMCYANGWLK